MYIILEKSQNSEIRSSLDALKIRHHRWKSDVRFPLHFFFSSATNFYCRLLSSAIVSNFCLSFSNHNYHIAIICHHNVRFL